MRHRPHDRPLEDPRHRRHGEVDLGVAQPREVPGAGDPEAQLAGDEGVATARVGGRRHFLLRVDGAEELGGFDRRRIGQGRALEIRGIHVGAVLPEKVLEAPGVFSRVDGADREAERVAPGHPLRHGEQLVLASGHVWLAVGAHEPGVSHDFGVHVEHVLRHVQRDRVPLALVEPALPRARQVVVATEALAGRDAVLDRLQHAVAGEVRHLDRVDQRQVGPFAGRYRDLELRVEVGPENALLLDPDTRLPREALDELVHDFAVGAGEAVPVADGGLRLGARAPHGGGQGRHGGADDTGQHTTTTDGTVDRAHRWLLGGSCAATIVHFARLRTPRGAAWRGS